MAETVIKVKNLSIEGNGDTGGVVGLVAATTGGSFIQNIISENIIINIVYSVFKV